MSIVALRKRIQCKSAVFKYLKKSRKPVASLIENHEKYFKDYENADDIYFLGFSFDDVDMPYVEKSS